MPVAAHAAGITIDCGARGTRRQAAERTATLDTVAPAGGGGERALPAGVGRWWSSVVKDEVVVANMHAAVVAAGRGALETPMKATDGTVVIGTAVRTAPYEMIDMSSGVEC